MIRLFDSTKRCMKALDRLLKTAPDAASFNPEIQVTPVYILRPGHDHQREVMILTHQAEPPKLLFPSEKRQ